jgi:hypothetical protein
MSYVSKRFDVDDVTLVALFTDTYLVISGGVVTDDGGAGDKVNVSACTYLYGRSARVAPAITALTVVDTQKVYIDPADNTIKTSASSAGMVPLAGCAVSGGVVTPTDERRLLATVVDGTPE